jgi:CBS-domain-containing membrane protein
MTGREQLQAGDLTADQVMNSDVVSTAETAPIEQVAQLLLDHDIDLLPVVQDDRLIGIIGRSDVLNAFLRMAEKRHEKSAHRRRREGA